MRLPPRPSNSCTNGLSIASIHPNQNSERNSARRNQYGVYLNRVWRYDRGNAYDIALIDFCVHQCLVKCVKRRLSAHSFAAGDEEVFREKHPVLGHLYCFASASKLGVRSVLNRPLKDYVES